jgi:methyl-accepting chemotaxis protein
MTMQTNVQSEVQSQGLFRVFTDRKIATKIFVGFGCALAIMTAISAIAYIEFGKVRYDFSEYSRKSANGGTVTDIDRQFLAFRRYIGEVSDNMEENISSADKARGIVRERIASAVKDIKNPERLSKIKHIAAEFEIYSKDFDKIVPLRREQAKLIKDVLDPVGQKLRIDLEQLQKNAAAQGGNNNAVILVGEAIKLVMLVRLDGQKALARHDEAAVKAVEKAFADLKLVWTSLERTIAGAEDRRQFDQVRANSDKYHEALLKALHDSKEVDALMNGEMRPKARAIAADAEAIKLSLIEDQKQTEQEVSALIAWSNSLILVLSLGGIVLGIAFAWLIGRAISKPVVGLSTGMRELAGGNMAVTITGVGRKDEIGDMASAVQVFKDNMIEADRLRGEATENERRSVEQRKADMHKLADQFESAVGEIIETVSSASTELEASAGTLTSTAVRAQELTTAVAAASEEASTNVQSVASATEEMASSVNEISRQVQESARIAGEAVEQAHKTNERVGELSKAASRIGDVVELINTIAGQTNLLALNATIEAARAGEAGRGFAVVASEVKALAEQTAKATGEISQQIKGIQDATDESVVAIKEIGSTIGRMSEIASTIASAVEEQGAATQEIARNVQQAAQGTQEVSSNITDVQRGASETGSASSQVLSAAQSLSSESNRLKLEVGKFLNTVRVA